MNEVRHLGWYQAWRGHSTSASYAHFQSPAAQLSLVPAMQGIGGVRGVRAVRAVPTRPPLLPCRHVSMFGAWWGLETWRDWAGFQLPSTCTPLIPG